MSPLAWLWRWRWTIGWSLVVTYWYVAFRVVESVR